MLTKKLELLFYILRAGDMNRAIGNDHLGIKGNKPNISYGGTLLRNKLENENLFLLNNSEKVEGGPWTWVNRQDPNRKSCLDLIIISNSLLPYFTKLIIDDDKKFTPRRVKKMKKKVDNFHFFGPSFFESYIFKYSKKKHSV